MTNAHAQHATTYDQISVSCGLRCCVLGGARANKSGIELEIVTSLPNFEGTDLGDYRLKSILEIGQRMRSERFSAVSSKNSHVSHVILSMVAKTWTAIEACPP